MKVRSFFAALVAFSFVVPVHAADSAQPKYSASQSVKKSKRTPLEVTIYPKRHRRAYSFSYADTIDTRRFTDPSYASQPQGGPFDSGFFFATPRGPFGGYTPYMH